MASDINVVVLVGRLTRDCEFKTTSTAAGAFSVCRFSVAVNRRKKSGDSWVDEPSYFDVVLMGRSADSLKTYLTKGRQVSIEGELRQDRWEQDGQTRSRVEIYANNVQLLSSPTTESSARPQVADNDRRNTAPAPAASNAAGFSPEAFEDKDIPF